MPKQPLTIKLKEKVPVRELKACQCCEDTAVITCVEIANKSYFRAECTYCTRMTVLYKAEDDAIEEWNRRR